MFREKAWAASGFRNHHKSHACTSAHYAKRLGDVPVLKDMGVPELVGVTADEDSKMRKFNAADAMLYSWP
jgi:hypothetical protein